MKKRTLITTLLLTILSSFCAHAQDPNTDPANDGKTDKFVKDGAIVQIYNQADGLQADGGPWILVKTGQDNAGAGIYRIKSQADGTYLQVQDDKLSQTSSTKSVAGDGKTTYDFSKVSTWVLILHGDGWSILSRANGAMALSRKQAEKTLPLILKTDMQRDQGTPTQRWMIKQTGFAVNPELGG
jgi:hypothetical protein